MTAPKLSDAATVVEFGALKAGLRYWIDTYLDHGTMLGADDPLVEPLTSAASKVFRFGAQESTTEAEKLAIDLAWPTVEAVAVLLRRMSHQVLAELPRAVNARIGVVSVRETHLNFADFDSEEDA